MIIGPGMMILESPGYVYYCKDLYTLDRSKSKKIQYRVHPNPEWTKTRNSRISAADDGRTARRGWHERSGPQRAPTETGSIR